jgi:hypothetical protein
LHVDISVLDVMVIRMKVLLREDFFHLSVIWWLFKQRHVAFMMVQGLKTFGKNAIAITLLNSFIRWLVSGSLNRMKIFKALRHFSLRILLLLYHLRLNFEAIFLYF